MEFSLVLPIYNEARCLEKNVIKIMKYLNEFKNSYEIIIAEDGSKDKSYEIARKLSNKYDNIKTIHFEDKLGRGRALKNAFSHARGKHFGYMDIDLATEIKHLKELIEYSKKYDIVTGSRYLKNSKTNRSVKRRFFSWAYNLIARVMFKSKIYDHQCGFKAFKREKVLELNKISEHNHWFWDTEILILAQKKGYKVKEFPVTWIENRKTKVNARKDSIKMFFSLMKLRVKT